MAGPWEKYGGQAEGPWAKYAKAEPVGVGEGVVTGMGDAVQGGAQLLVNSLPQGLVEGVNNLTAKANELPVIGPAMRSLGMVPASAQQVNEQVTSRDADYEARRAAAGQTGFDPARMAGNILATAPVAAALPVGGSLMGSIAAGAGAGTAMSALQPVTGATEETFDTQKGRQMLAGAGVGAALGPLAYGAGRLIAPKVDPNVAKLADEGVQMTPGQIMGGGYKRVEDALTSIPLVGDQVRTAQRASIESLNRAAVNRALAPLGDKIDDATPVGREMVSAAAQKVKDAYNTLLPKLRLVPDESFAAEITSIPATRNLTPQMRAEFERIVNDRIRSRLTNGVMDGQTFKNIESELSRTARNYAVKGGPAEAELGTALGDLLGSFRGLLSRSNPQQAERLAAINQAFAGMKRIEGAAGASNAVDGVFTPNNLSQAVRSGDPSRGRAAYARGDAMLQDLSDSAKKVLPQSVPDSGTPFRGLVGAGLATGAGMYVNPALGAVAPMVYGAYTAPMQRLAQALLTGQRSRPLQALGDRVANSGVTLSPLAAALMSSQSP
jgi:hypothetical protein